MPKLICLMRTWSTNEHYNADGDYAVTEIDKSFADTIRRRIEMVKKAKAESSELLRMEFSEWSPEFISYGDAEEMFGEEKVNEVNDPGSIIFKIKASGMVLLKKLPKVRLDSCVMSVTDDGIRWSAFPKHSDIELSTGEITVKDLEEHGL